MQALRGADFALAEGEIHALLGENGAGKSTLLQVAYGMLPADGGTILLGGRTLRLRSPRDARLAGIGMVHQHFTSIGSLTVAENLALVQGGYRRSLPRAVEAFLVDLPPDSLVDSLSVGHKQRLEIAKALATGARVLLLDEPSAALAPAEIETFLELARRFAAEGGAVALVTHKLPEVFAAAHRVTVLRNGKVTLSAPLTGQTADSLATAMLGTGMEPSVDSREAVTPARTGLAVATFGGVELHAGVLVGVAAVEGNGQRALLRQLAGVASESGSPRRGQEPAAFVPEDRTTEGLIPEFSVAENLILGRDRDSRWVRGWRLDWNAARAHASRIMESFGVVAPGTETPVGSLSGGNQQKVVMARALDGESRLLVAENPTRGLDLRATADVHARLRAAAHRGMAVVVYSSDLDEVLALGERILVVHHGRVLEAPAGSDRQRVGAMMLGLSAE